jgi:ABC-2 type transport system permease protein
MSTLAHGTGRGRPPSRTVHAPLDHREVHAMNAQIQLVLTIHEDRLARLHAEAHRERLARSTRTGGAFAARSAVCSSGPVSGSPPRRPRRSGRSIPWRRPARDDAGPAGLPHSTGEHPMTIAGRPMATAARELSASAAFIERNFNLSRRYWGWELAFLVYAVAGALSISFIGAAAADKRLIFSLVIGAIFWNYLSTVFSFIAETISWERWEGTLEYTMMAPVRRASQLAGSTTYAILYGLVHTSVILLVLTLFFELDLSHANFVTATVVMFAGSFSVVGIGIMAAILPLLYVERGAQMTFVIQSCLLVVSGVYYPVSVLPGWMQVASAFSPATYILDGVRKGLMEGASVTSVFHDLWPLALMGAVLIPTGLWLFGRAEHYAKRTGKLKRVG